MREHVVRWMSVLCCAALAAGCGERDRGAAKARSAVGGAGAGPARLVQDARPGVAPVGSSPHGFVVSGTTAFFAADDGSSGFELWKTQGVPGDATLVADVRPGGASSLPPDARLEGVAWNGGLLFAADDGSRGTELWFSDGTASGTRLVKDINVGTASSSPRRFALAGGKVFFVADTVAYGAEVWVTDGTEGGTRLVADVEAQAGVGSDPAELTAVGTTLFFSARDVRGRELWKTDAGTLATSIVKDIAASDGDAGPTRLVAFQGKLFFVATEFTTGSRLLHSSDGTEGRTAPVVANGQTAAQAPVDPDLLTPFGGALYFAGGAGGSREIWAWDPAALQFNAWTLKGFTATDPTALAAAGSRLYAALSCAAPSACSPKNGRELQAWDGASWTFLADVAPGTLDSDPHALTPVGSSLFFAATGAGVPVLWRTDGSPGGTQRVEPSLEVGDIVALSGKAVLSGNDRLTGAEPWVADLTSPAGSALGNLHPDVASSFPRHLTAWNGKLYFSADDGLVGRELWSADPVTTTAGLVTDDLQIGATASSPADLVDAGAMLLFTASSLEHGRELRWLPGDGLDPTFLVTDLRSGLASALSVPAYLTRLGGTVLFVGDDGLGAGGELWRTDGTAGGTVLVKDVYPGPLSSFPAGLVAIGGNVWFVADDTDPGNPFPKAYRSDGTAGGTVPVAFAAGDIVYDPAWFVDFAGSTAMSAVHPAFGRTLFVWDPGAPGILRTVNAFGALDASDPVAFVVHGGAGYFGARDASSPGTALWKTLGYSDATTRVKAIGTLSGGGRFSSPVSLDGKLWFVGNDDVHGDELWTSDGSEAGTNMLADVLLGSGGSAEGSVLVPLPGRGHVIYAASDGVSGRELWISNGTVLNTRLLQDLWPGAASSNPADFTRLGDLLYFTADDGSTGRELWVLDTSPAALDLTAPVPVCPGFVPVEATTTAGADPAFAISASDDRGGPVTVTFSHVPGTYIAVNSFRTITATAADAMGNRAQCSFGTGVQDTTPPALTCPADLRLEATSAAGAVGTFTGAAAAVAVDLVTVPAIVTYAPPSGTTFPLGAGKSPGTTAVTVNARDAAANASTPCAFNVVVSDTTAPAVTCPANVVVEATQPSGATATWGTATATDAVSDPGAIAITFDATPAVSVFPLGTSTVTARGRDEAGNLGSCGFTVQVRDTTPPTITCPPSRAVEATRYAGADATFATTTADAVSLAPTVTYDYVAGPRASGAPVTAAFPYGATTVTATAFDGFNTSSPCSFTITVQDTTAPALSCPGTPVIAEAASALGATVVLAGKATASDVPGTPPLPIGYRLSGVSVPDSGTLAPLGTSTASASATDRGGNTGSCSFSVVVQDTTGPALTATCADRIFEATSPAGASVTNPTGFASDLVTAEVALSYEYLVHATSVAYPSGLHPLGTTSVDAFALDAAGNRSAACTFTSTVQDTLPPVPTCPAELVVEATSAAGATVLGWPDATGVDTVTPTAGMTPGNGLVLYDPLPGSLFPVGLTTVTATIRDAALNAATCTFAVRVVDTTPPVPTCPAPTRVEATGPAGATATFAATAVDAVSATSVTYSHQPGDPFPLGTTVVTATATDLTGNAATCQLDVVVVDTTPPAHLGACGFDLFFEAASASGGVVENPVAFAADLVTTVADLGYRYVLSGTETPYAGGVVHPIGISSVDAFAIDAAGNVGTACTFRSIVRDSTGPVATCPSDVTAEAVSSSGATVGSWGVATGVDAVTPAGLMTEGLGRVGYSPARGSTFAVGDTTVTASVRDEAGNPGTCTFRVHVVDTTPPVPSCPAAVAAVEATGNGAGPVTFAATGVDAVSATSITYDHQPGDPFPVGTTLVTATARDAAGNAATCSFQVEVVDTTPPSITCPPDRRSVGNGNVPVPFPAPTIFDAGTPSSCSFSSTSADCRLVSTRQSGDLFQVGVTPVTFTATDKSGNSASCTMTVTVNPTPFGGGGGGCGTGGGGLLALLGLLAAALRLRRRS